MRWPDFLIFNGRIALSAILANRLRSALTLLGMLIGVMCVTLVLSFSQMIKKGIGDAFDSFGSNMAILSMDNSADGRKIILTMRDMQAISRHFDKSLVAPQLFTSEYVSYVDKNEKTDIWGVTPDYFAIRKMRVVQGHMLSAEELQGTERVLMLSKSLAEQLFGKEANAAGETVKINSVPYLVAGVIGTSGASMGAGDDYQAYLPIYTVRQRFIRDDFSPPDMVYAAYINFGPDLPLAQGTEQLTEFLRARYLVDANDDLPFRVNSTEEFMNKMESAMSMMQLGLMAIASVSLLVGGIGIMNIMLVSVAERTREIGIRIAVGAPPHLIRAQFLMEAAVLCLIGGLAGMIMAQLILRAIARFSETDIALSPVTAILVMGFSVLVGLIAGYLPAARASRLDPVEALRTS